MEELEKVKTAGKRPRDEADDSTTGVPCLKQPKLSFFNKSLVSQQHVDNLIMHYIVSEMKPLRTVETNLFRALVTGLCSSAVVMCRQMLQERINAAYDKMKQKIVDELNSVQYVCTKADLWSSANRSF
jgi:hypothetical protein